MEEERRSKKARTDEGGKSEVVKVKDEALSVFINGILDETEKCISDNNNFRYAYIPALFFFTYPFENKNGCITIQSDMNPQNPKMKHICTNWLHRRDGIYRNYMEQYKNKTSTMDIARSCSFFRNRVFTEFERWCVDNLGYNKVKYKKLFDNSEVYLYYKYNDKDYEESFLLDEPSHSNIKFGVARKNRDATVVNIEPLILNISSSYELELDSIDEGITHLRLSASRPYYHTFNLETYINTHGVRLYVNNVSKIFEYYKPTCKESSRNTRKDSIFTLIIPGTMKAELKDIDEKDTIENFILSLITGMTLCKSNFCLLQINKLQCTYDKCLPIVTQALKNFINTHTSQNPTRGYIWDFRIKVLDVTKDVSLFISTTDDPDATSIIMDTTKIIDTPHDSIKSIIRNRPLEENVSKNLCLRLGDGKRASYTPDGFSDVTTEKSVFEVSYFKDWKYALEKVKLRGKDTSKQKVLYLFTGIGEVKDARSMLSMIEAECGESVNFTLELC